MGALSKDRATSYKEGIIQNYPVAASAKVYAGSLVCVNATGFLVPANDATALRFVGVAMSGADNSAGADAGLSVQVRRDGVFLFDALSITQAMVGSPMYVHDDHTFDESSSNAVVCGVLVNYVSATSGWIDIEVAIKTPDTPLAADDMTVGDPANLFTGLTVKTQLQELAIAPHFITLPHFTGWTKDGAAHVIALPLVESPVALRIKGAFVNLGTAPGSAKTLALTVNGSALVSIAGTNTQGEALALSIAIAAATDIVISANETSAGAGADCDIILVVERDGGA